MNSTFASFQIGKSQFSIDSVNIISGINFTSNMDDIVIFKATHYMANRFGFTNIGQELVTQPFTFRGPFYQACDIHELHRGWQNALRFYNLGQLVQTRIRHWHHTRIGFNGTEREVSGFNTRLCQRVEQGGFTNVRQAHNTAFESHVLYHLK